MHEVVVALFALGIGALFCFYGYKAMRFLLPLWGLVAGYWLGAELVHLITNDSLFGTTLGIVVGLVFGLIGALLAYLYYAVAIILFLGFVGYWLGSGLFIALGVDPGFLTAAVGVALGLVLVVAGIMGNAPKFFLLFFTAFAGAALMAVSILLLANVVNLPDLENGIIATVTNQSWLWQLIWLGAGAFGFWTQLASAEEEELRWSKEWGGK